MLSALSRHFSKMTNLRNIGISAHIDSGKTTFTERVLFYTGRINAIHEVRGSDNVGAKMDSMELERERGITIQSAATFCKWKDWNFNLIDTPGHVDFTIEVERSLRVLDGAILIVCGASGVQSQTLTVNRQMERYKVPRIIFINKLDRGGANNESAIDQIRAKVQQSALPVQLPIGLEENHLGVIDLISQKAFYYEGNWGMEEVEREIPQDKVSQAQEYREQLLEGLADADDLFAEQYLEGDVQEQQIHDAIRRATIARKFSPILMGSAYKNKGVQRALDAVGMYLPSPYEINNIALDLNEDSKEVKLEINPKLPAVALAFKLEENKFGQLTYIRMYQGKVKKGDFIKNTRTQKKVKVSRMVKMHSNEMIEIQEAEAGDIFALFGVECNSGDTFTDGQVNYSLTSMYIPEPVMSLSVTPTNKLQLDNFTKAIKRFLREDPTFHYRIDEESGQIIISGMGELHLQIYAERMKREYGVDLALGPPTVNYRETITQKAEFNYLHKKQTGGAGQFAGVAGYIEPIQDLKPGEIVQSKFVDKSVGMNISPEYKQAIAKGFQQYSKKGPQVGYPLVNMQYVLTDGQTHSVDSSSNAFMAATKGSLRQALPNAGQKILEPVMLVEVTCPAESQASVVTGLTKRGGFMRQSIPKEDGTFNIIVEAPLANMFGYSSEIRSNTQGQGEFSMEFLRYEEVNESQAQELREEYQDREDDDQ